MASSAISSTSSISRSHRSPRHFSHSPSPARATDAPTLEVLVGLLLTSKRSLNSITHLHRASAIISEARATLEAIAVVSARSAFLQRSLAAQLRIVETIRSQLITLSQQAQEDFAVVLRELDDADALLESALEGLRSTTVERAFRPKNEEPKTLASFIDEKPVEEIRESLKNGIDGLNEAMSILQEENQSLEDELGSIKDALCKPDTVMPQDSISSYDLKQPNLAALLNGMEDHAKEMAIGLESLVKHFDLCVTAIRHTEGGGAAAQNIASDLPEGLDMAERSFITGGTTPAAITSEEHVEMLHILQSDASEVEEVVSEIQDRIGEMELQLSTVLTWRDRTLTHSSNINLAFHLLSQLGTKLPLYTSHTTSTFITKWQDHHIQISTTLESMSSLHDVYANYLTAYDRLIVEVARRKSIEKQMHKIAQDAQAKLEKLYVDDIARREAFRDEQGDYLPSDIWDGLANPPDRFSVTKVVEMEGEAGSGGVGEEGLAGEEEGAVGTTRDFSKGIPELEKGKIEEALKRLRKPSAAAAASAETEQ